MANLDLDKSEIRYILMLLDERIKANDLNDESFEYVGTTKPLKKKIKKKLENLWS